MCTTVPHENKRRRILKESEYAGGEALATSLPEANVEQKLIIETISNGNVSVDAVAGGGKTTLALKIAEKYPSKNVLLVLQRQRRLIKSFLQILSKQRDWSEGW